MRVNPPVFLALLGLVLVITLIRLWGPVARARHLEAENARLRAEIAATKAEHAPLEEEKRQLASDEGAESVVRQRGYVKPGERRLVFVPGKDAKDKGKGE